MRLQTQRPVFRRAFLCAVLALSGLAVTLLRAADAAERPAPHYLGDGKADQAEGRRALSEFRQMGIAGAYWLAFELQVLPHRGEERTIKGQLFGRRSASGPVSLLVLGDERWLLRSGTEAAAWRWTPAGGGHALAAGEVLNPVAGTDLTVFDLQMPFLYWDDFVYEGLAKIRGRPAYSFLLYPPAQLAAQRPELSAVRIAIDSQFHALVQAELLGTKGESEKTITVLDLKKSGEQWLVKSIDLRNARTRDKTRFNVGAAALHLEFPAEALTPETLGGALPALGAVKPEAL